jgi:hypothetical protein
MEIVKKAIFCLVPAVFLSIRDNNEKYGPGITSSRLIGQGTPGIYNFCMFSKIFIFDYSYLPKVR